MGRCRDGGGLRPRRGDRRLRACLGCRPRGSGARMGRRGHEKAQQDVMGTSSVEWPRYMHDVISLKDPPEEISAAAVGRLEATYREGVPLIDGAKEIVAGLAKGWPLGVASSSNRPTTIDLVLDLGWLDRFFRATISFREGSAWQTFPRRLPGGHPLPRCASEGNGRDRGVPQRHPVGQGGGDARRGDPERALYARRRGPRRGRRRAPVDLRADARRCGRGRLIRRRVA